MRRYLYESVLSPFLSTRHLPTRGSAPGWKDDTHLIQFSRLCDPNPPSAKSIFCLPIHISPDAFPPFSCTWRESWVIIRCLCNTSTNADLRKINLLLLSYTFVLLTLFIRILIRLDSTITGFIFRGSVFI